MAFPNFFRPAPARAPPRPLVLASIDAICPIVSDYDLATLDNIVCQFATVIKSTDNPVALNALDEIVLIHRTVNLKHSPDRFAHIVGSLQACWIVCELVVECYHNK